MAAVDVLVHLVNEKISNLQNRLTDRSERRQLIPKDVLTPTQYKKFQAYARTLRAYHAADRAAALARRAFEKANTKQDFYLSDGQLWESTQAVETRIHGTKAQREKKIKALKQLRSSIMLQAAAGEVSASTLLLAKKLGVL